MSRLIELLAQHLGLVAAIIGSLLVIVPVVRQGAVRLCKACVFLIRAPFIILEKVTGLELLVGSMDLRLAKVEHEMQDNDGGSIKDHTKRQESRHRADFWSKGRPAMELHLDGRVNLVSEALCRLFGVRDTEHLHGRNWLRFVDSAHADRMQDLIAELDEETTLFRFSTTLYDDRRDSVGVWEFNAHAVDPPVAGKRLISGHWSPVDEKAREISARFNWAS